MGNITITAHWQATFYGTDGWNIMKGSCNYGDIGTQEVGEKDLLGMRDRLGGSSAALH